MKTLSSKSKIFLLVSLSLLLILGSFFAFAKELVPPSGLTTLGQFFANLEKFFLWVAIPLVALAIIGAGVVLLTSFGIPERIALGKRIMTYAGIGLIVALIGVGLGEWLGEETTREANLPKPSSMEQTDNLINLLSSSIADTEKELSEAKNAGDKEKVKSLTKELENLRMEKAALESWKNELAQKKQTEVEEKIKGWEAYYRGAGYIWLANKGIKIEGDWYKTDDGGKYNPATMEYIKPNGQKCSNISIMPDGSLWGDCK